MTQQESFGAGDIIQRLFQKGKPRVPAARQCTQGWPGSNAKGRNERQKGSARRGGQRGAGA